MMKRIAVFTLLAAAAGLAQTVNCLVAVVNNEIITLLDVQVTAEFGLGNASSLGEGTDAKLAALDALIDRKVVLDLAREARGLTGEELDAAVAGLRSALGKEAFAAKLAKFGLREKDLEPYLEERILYDRALALRFSPTIPVSVTEVERQYRDIYAPEQSRLGLAVEPFERVAETIESKIRDERRALQTADWVRDLRKRATIELKKDCLK
jgi:hypothetical protein